MPCSYGSWPLRIVVCDGSVTTAVRVREGEARAARGEPIEVRRLRRAAVRRQRVGAQRVDRDEQDVDIGVACERECRDVDATRR